MSLEAKLELLTAAIERNTEIMLAINKGEYRLSPKEYDPEEPAQPAKKDLPPANEDEAKAQRDAERDAKKPTLSPSGEPSVPTGESSSPALDYAKDVKPITIRLSKEKGRETTIAVLQRFGVKGAQELDAAQWAEYIAHCEKVLAGGEV